MGRVAMTPKYPCSRPNDDLEVLPSNQKRGELDDIDFDDYCDDPDTGIGNVSVGFDGEPGELANELRSIFGAFRKIETEE